MNGIINIYKEKGYTSHDVVAVLRGVCKQKKIGHTGTLDPDAEGVLPVCLGTATKVCDLLTEKDKEYEAVLLLGIETDTQDAGGNVLRKAEAGCPQEKVVETVQSFCGTYWQVPPMYSALKVNGRKLCDLAREGKEVARKARPVTISAISIEWIKMPRVKIKVHCSKGTYIRTLCHDIGKKLGCGGCMEELLRTRVGIFCLPQARKLAQVRQLAAEGRLEEAVMPIDRLFADDPAAEVSAAYRKLLENGNRLPRKAVVGNADSAQRVRIYMDGEFFGLYEPDAACGDYKPVKLFWPGK